jgi:hypothetical protein
MTFLEEGKYKYHIEKARKKKGASDMTRINNQDM